MPLVLNLRIGEAVYVDDTAFELTEILSPQHVRMKVADRTFDVRAGRGREAMPNVFFGLGDRTMSTWARLSIDAPRSMKILHSARYPQLQGTGEATRPVPGTDLARQYKIAPDIVERAIDELGLSRDSAMARLKHMLRQSVPITAPGWNRRYDEYVMFVDGSDTLIAVDVLADEEREYFDNRRWEERRVDN